MVSSTRKSSSKKVVQGQQQQLFAAPQYNHQFNHQPMFSPLGPPPPKKSKTGLFTSSSNHVQQVPSNIFPPQIRSSPITKATSSSSSSSKRKQAPPPSSSSSRKKKAAPNPALQNPYSTSRGLRHFSMKVCEKVEEKGTTTYNEVADELVRELKQAEEAINRAAIARGESPPIKKNKLTRDGKIQKKNHDDKNIRRRVYDALNVLMAMDIITKEKKEITWRGLPGSRVPGQDHFGNGSSLSSSHHRGSGKSRSERVKQLQDEVAKRQADIKRKRECLQELMTQNVCFHNLMARNHARESDMQETTTIKQEEQEVEEEEAKKQECEEVKDIKNEKIPVPFIIVNTDSRAVVQCEMCPKRTNISFDFSLPFEINDDNEILKRLGMNHTSKEELERLLPPDVYQYCNSNGLLKGVTGGQK